MRAVLPLELAGKQTLDFDLYNEKGEILVKKGEQIPAKMVLELNSKPQILYRLETTYTLEDFELDPVEILEKNKHKSVFSEKTKETLATNSRKIMQSVVDGKTINVKEVNEMKDVLVDDVSSRIDEIKGINELRVFDSYTFSHTVNVSSMSTALGLILKLKDDEISELAMGALLHDVGKMLIPKDILFKPGKLDPEEFEIVKTHTTKGYDYIKSKNDLSETIAKIALEHQEKYSGFGYPNKLKEEEISYYAQIVAIVDVYDALTSERVYKKGMPNADALRIMISDGSKAFNPYMLYRFIYLANNREKINLV